MSLMPSLGLRPPDEPLYARVVLGLAFQFVPDGSISSEPLLVHPREHRNVCIHVVVNPNYLLAVVTSMQATYVLLQRADATKSASSGTACRAVSRQSPRQCSFRWRGSPVELRQEWRRVSRLLLDAGFLPMPPFNVITC